MRSIVFRYDDIHGLGRALEETRGSLPLPRGESVLDGEWVLVLFEIGSRRRATATAARGVRAAGDPHVEFEPRDWDRLQSFVAARSDGPKSVRCPASASMPAAEVSSSDEPPRSVYPIESSRVPAGARVLLIAAGDDAVRESVSVALAEVGLAVVVAASIDESNTHLASASFDAIVVDGRVDGDPIVLVRSLRRNKPCSPPVLLLAQRTSSRELVEAFACGADDFLPAPFRPSELGARVFGLLRRARTEAQADRGDSL